MTSRDLTLEQRFWIHVNFDGPVPTHRPTLGNCWLWTGAINADGYGLFKTGDNEQLAHRISWRIAFGFISKQILHHCDNPPCIRPSHLWQGTQIENIRDMQRKKRGNIGTRNGLAKLDPEKVARIRELYKQIRNYSAIGRMFGVDPKSIWQIIKDVSWKNF